MTFELEKELRHRVVVMDGAMATMVFSTLRARPRGEMPVDGFNLSHPEIISRIHREYLLSGAEIIKTNTFGSQSIALEKWRLAHQAARIMAEGVGLARKAADDYMREFSGTRKWVAASIGPTAVALSKLSGPEYTDMRRRLHEDFAMQTRIAIDEGADIILLETIFDALNGEVAARAAADIISSSSGGVKLMISLTLDEDGRLYAGQQLAPTLEIMETFNPLCIGLNCGCEPETASQYLDALQPFHTAVGFHPNVRKRRFPGIQYETSEEFASHMAPILKAGKVNIAGGCCGTSPAHISALCKVNDTAKARKIPDLT